jgi:hypothetical protein
MGADPEPNDRVGLAMAHSSISTCHTSRENRFCWVHSSEPKTGVAWVLLEELVGFSSLLPDVRRERGERVSEAPSGLRGHSLSGSRSCVRPARCSAKASLPKAASLSDEREKSSSHRRSEASSSSSYCPRASCSLSGSFAASSNAFCNSDFMERTSTRRRLYQVWPAASSPRMPRCFMPYETPRSVIGVAIAMRVFPRPF